MITRRDEARDALRQIEAALDAGATSSGWPVRPTLSRWVDALTVIAETSST